jgi:mono/diheme cytochrome c family protein
MTETERELVDPWMLLVIPAVMLTGYDSCIVIRCTGRALVILCAAVGFIVLAGAAMFLSKGISAKPEPSAVEAALARRLRSMAIPAAAKNRQNPVTVSQDVLADGTAHWADHCAVCHGNDGSGDTAIGRNLYPRVPDMRRPATQNLSDGTLFYIIEEGVKLTGMPAWGNGTPEGETASWHLVHFIRRLPHLTEEDLERMKEMNPKSPDEWREEEEMRKFLEGEKPKSPAPPKHKHGRDD